MRKKSKREVYEDLLAQYRPTVRSLILEILRIKMFNLQKGKQPVIPPGAIWVPEEDRLKHLPLKYIALVDKDGIVVEVIRINEETADQLLSKSVRLIHFDPKSEIVKKGMWYNKKKFYLKGSNEEKN
jgi:hypothetical protein